MIVWSIFQSNIFICDLSFWLIIWLIIWLEYYMYPEGGLIIWGLLGKAYPDIPREKG